ncbi:rhodanese-like domain-containing protein [Sodalis endosymbiont of Henestaris halophilus]|nr:hypothetical protein [Sodalis endosymbiont of Henestaris halophilus]
MINLTQSENIYLINNESAVIIDLRKRDESRKGHIANMPEYNTAVDIKYS